MNISPSRMITTPRTLASTAACETSALPRLLTAIPSTANRAENPSMNSSVPSMTRPRGWTAGLIAATVAVPPVPASATTAGPVRSPPASASAAAAEPDIPVT